MHCKQEPLIETVVCVNVPKCLRAHLCIKLSCQQTVYILTVTVLILQYVFQNNILLSQMCCRKQKYNCNPLKTKTVIRSKMETHKVRKMSQTLQAPPCF